MKMTIRIMMVKILPLVVTGGGGGGHSAFWVRGDSSLSNIDEIHINRFVSFCSTQLHHRSLRRSNFNSSTISFPRVGSALKLRDNVGLNKTMKTDENEQSLRRLRLNSLGGRESPYFQCYSRTISVLLSSASSIWCSYSRRAWSNFFFLSVFI